MPKVYLTEKDKKAAKAAENGKYIMGTISKYAEVRDMSTEELCILCKMGRTILFPPQKYGRYDPRRAVRHNERFENTIFRAVAVSRRLFGLGGKYETERIS